ncbi:hypothetical protein QE152_g30129 [Popillia japonica]|uniref:MACPF domain-containing protein n=1 Tax=Popillia japonica TaxID=7064 RepID=A0AAW1JES7_POPJA
MWSRAVLLVLVTTTVYYADAEDSNSQDLDAQLRVGHSINIFTRYGYLSISMKVVERNETNTDWIFREPTVDVFADVKPLTEHPTRNAKKVIFDGDFHMEFCDNLMQLLQAYFRNYSFEKLDRPWRAFSGSWQADNIAKNMGINSSFVHGDYCYVLLRLSRTRDTVKLGPIPSNVNLSDVVAREIDNIKVGDIDSVWTFIKKYGSHYINSYVTGNSLYQVSSNCLQCCNVTQRLPRRVPSSCLSKCRYDMFGVVMLRSVYLEGYLRVVYLNAGMTCSEITRNKSLF